MKRVRWKSKGGVNIMKHSLEVKSQSIEASGITKDYKEALVEYIWNGFEANATQVEVSYIPNDLGGLSEIKIYDNGEGISHSTLNDTFGTFLTSKKNSYPNPFKTKANKGKGRFSGFGIAAALKWSTVYKEGNENFKYEIIIESDKKNEFEETQIEKTNDNTGTEVTISQIDEVTVAEMSMEALRESLLKEFAWFLFLEKNRELQLKINGEVLKYEDYVDTELSKEKIIRLEENNFIISIVVWKNAIKEKYCIYYMDTQGITKGKDSTAFNRNTVNFCHSVFVKSAYFNNKKDVNCEEYEDEKVEQQTLDNEKILLRKLKHEIRKLIEEVLGKYLAEKADEAVKGMMDRKSFPQFGNDIYGKMKKRELISVTKELYQLESRIFYKLKPIQEKSLLGFLNLLLDSTERENILEFISQIVDLTPKQREDFADILKKTKLSNVIDSIRFIENRYKVIEGLKWMLYSMEPYTNERDHIQKIIEQHYWLFGEQYNLVTADKRMQKALEKYLYLLYGKDGPEAVLTKDDEEMRRMDIFLCGARKTEDGEGNAIKENLIVELKAPKVVLTKKVLRQIEDYMDFVKKQPQFNSQFCRWKFIAVCNEMDDDVKERRNVGENKTAGKKGLVVQLEQYELYALTWADVFESFELRHSFLLDKLNMDREMIENELQEEVKEFEGREAINTITTKLCARV